MYLPEIKIKSDGTVNVKCITELRTFIEIINTLKHEVEAASSFTKYRTMQSKEKWYFPLLISLWIVTFKMKHQNMEMLNNGYQNLHV
jgi:hypothetical protein